MTYAYTRDGSVLGRVTGWRGDVPIIDTTDRCPGSASSASSDLAGLPTASEPDGALDTASVIRLPEVTAGGRPETDAPNPDPAAASPRTAAGSPHR